MMLLRVKEKAKKILRDETEMMMNLLLNEEGRSK